MLHCRIIILLTIAFIVYGCSCGENKVISSNNNSYTESRFVTFQISDSTTLGSVIGVANIGDLRVGEVVETSIVILNSFEKPLIITGVKTTCGCVTVEYDKNPIMGGETKQFNIKYDSTNRYGFQISNISLITNHGNYIIRLETFVKSN